MDEPMIMDKPAEVEETVVEAAQVTRISIGTIRGKVNAIVHDPLALLVMDPLLKTVTKCYLEPDGYDKTHEVWGKMVAVTGHVRREPVTGRAIEVRNIKNIEIIHQAPARSFQQAKGIIPWQEGQDPPEVIIQRGRDDVY